VLTVTFNGLSKNYRSCGYRAGWMVVSGDLREARDYIEGLDMLALDATVRQRAGAARDSDRAWAAIRASTTWSRRVGRMCRQRDLAHALITAIPGVSCVKPKAALYMFPRLDPEIYPIDNDQDFIAELLQEERVLLVQGSGFNWPAPDHFRLVFLPYEDDLRDAIARIARFSCRLSQARRNLGVAAGSPPLAWSAVVFSTHPSLTAL
jgi:alanine-synthesizing transaminase